MRSKNPSAVQMPGDFARVGDLHPLANPSVGCGCCGSFTVEGGLSADGVELSRKEWWKPRGSAPGPRSSPERQGGALRGHSETPPINRVRLDYWCQ